MIVGRGGHGGWFRRRPCLARVELSWKTVDPPGGRLFEPQFLFLPPIMLSFSCEAALQSLVLLHTDKGMLSMVPGGHVTVLRPQGATRMGLLSS